MNEKRFTLDDEENGLCRCILVDGEEMPTCEICDLLNEQQATISALKEENEQLRGVNKEIGDDLYNCRLNKDIVSEKLKLWQDTLAEYDIYTIKDFEELMKNDN